jgi:antitoxin PrlF
MEKISITKRIHMLQRKSGNEQGASGDPSCGCSPSQGCSVEAVLSVDDRGQMVLPKDVREKAGIKSGDKLALISWEKNGSICCLALIKAENLSGMVKDVLDPLLKGRD